MKNALPLKAHGRPLPGFTLIEVLVVTTIIVMLAAMGFAGFRIARQKANNKATRSRIEVYTSLIEQYKQDSGLYPIPAATDEAVTIQDESWRVGAAKMLYQVLTGDGNNAIKDGEVASTGEQGSSGGKVYAEKILAPTQEQADEKGRNEDVGVQEGSGYYLIDAYGHPLQYQVAQRDRNGKVLNEAEMYSGGNIEIWSYGTLERPGDNDDARREWVTSWDKN